MKKKRLLVLLLAADAIWIWFILNRSSQSAAVSSEESGWVLAHVQRVLPFVTMHLLRKAAHFSEFAILGCLFFATWHLIKKPGILVPAGFGLLVAVCDELLQLSSEGRSCELRDILLDFTGVLTAVLMLRLLLHLLRKRQMRDQKTAEIKNRFRV